VNSEMKNELQKKGIERLEDIRFWLAVLRNFDQFTEPQKQKLIRPIVLLIKFMNLLNQKQSLVIS